MNRIPDCAEVNSKIFMDQAVAQTDHFPPGNLRMCLPKLLRNFSRSLADNFQWAHYSILDDFTIFKFVPVDSLNKFQGFPGCNKNVQKVSVIAPHR